jgi:predicted GNAT family N-acyltransferase
MRQVAVDDKQQNKGFGTELVETAEEFCREKGFTKIELNAREASVNFYLKLNYKIVGDPFIEVGIPHKKMIKVL